MPQPSIIPKHGGYKKLLTYQNAVIIYDLTMKFCARYKSQLTYKTYEQMTGAARSGKQNIVEGSQVSGTSKKSEIKLIGVSRGSFEELLEDYTDFLRQNDYQIWTKDHLQAQQVRKLAYTSNRSHQTYSSYLQSPISAANTLICLINQTNYLLDKQLATLEKDFLQNGGLTERMYAARKAKHAR